MKLEQSFEVAAPLERVWKTLVDVERVAPCLPGAAIIGRNEDGSYNGTFTIKIGPTTASYTGKLEMEQIDEASHSATLQAQGTDKRGQGGAKATIVSKLSSGEGGATHVAVDTDYHITGRLARFGRGGMIEDISERLLREFATRLQASLAQRESGGQVAAPGAPAKTVLRETVPESPPATARTVLRQSVSEPEAPPPVGASAEAAGPPPHAGAPEPPRPPAPGPPPPPPSGPPPQPPAPSEPIEGLSLLGSVMVDRVKRNPKPLLALLGGLLLLRFVRRRR